MRRRSGLGIAAKRFREQYLGLLVGRFQAPPLGELVQNRARIREHIGGNLGKIIAQRRHSVAREIQREDLVDRLARRIERIIGNLRIGLPLARKAAGDEAQAADAEGEVVRAQEFHCARRGTSARGGEPRQPPPVELGAQGTEDRVRVG